MRLAALLLLAICSPAHAAWEWSAPVAVSSASGAAIFPHLESANRQGVAVSDGAVAVAWEDNRDGTPQCYLAIKSPAQTGFQQETRLSQGECYEPVVSALDDGRFLAAWEEAGAIHARVLPGGEAHRLSPADGVQATLATGKGSIYAAWAERAGKFRRIVVARLTVVAEKVEVKAVRPVEAQPPRDEQGWPALAVGSDGSVSVAWEDRRNRHTVPLISRSPTGTVFATPRRLPDHKSGSVGGLGAGTGAMRPTVTAWGPKGVVAAWLDKRDFLSGYDVYAAFDRGNGRSGKNLPVQDSFGDNMAQWHAQVVSNRDGKLVVVWDDARDGTQDVWAAEWNGKAFSDNFAVLPASGPGTQSDPVATLDAAGALHVVWLERDAAGVTQLRYARGAPQ